MKKFLLSFLCVALVGCQPSGPKASVRVDGSSTVFPITEAVAVEFRSVHPNVDVTVGVSGTGGGFKKFCAGEIDINDASRPIKDQESRKAAENKVGFIELPVAYDGLSVVVNKANNWVDYLTVAELKKIWEPGSKVKNWNQVREGWPDRKISLYGPGVDSGTFDYFTEVINGKSAACRSDFVQSEDDNVLVRGVAGDKDSLAFFGFVYYSENEDKLKIVPIDGGGGPVAPSMATINDGSYTPLARPIFIYVSANAAERTEIKDFVHFYIDNAPTLVKEVGYVPLPDGLYSSAKKRFDSGTLGVGATGGH